MQSMLSSILRQGNPLSDLNKGLKLYLDGTYDSVNGWFVDKSGNGNHGTPYNGATTGTGVVGDGMSFDGASYQYIDLGADNVSGIDLFCDGVGHEFTVNLWADVDNVNTGTLIGKAGAASSNRTFQIYKYTDDYYICIIRGVVGIENYWLTKNENYCMLTVTYNGTNAVSYYNGAYENTLNIGSAAEKSENIIIGARTGGTGFPLAGNEDEIRIYDRALTANEVKALYRLKRV